MPPENRQTSARHTGILDSYRNGDSAFGTWVKDNLGEITLTRWAWGEADLRWILTERFIMPDGVMFGGHITAVADHFVALGAMTVLTDNGERFRTSRLEMNFFRPLKVPYADIHVRVTNASRTLIHLEASFTNEAGQLAALAHAVQVRQRVNEAGK
ncbi:MAG: PaaI family thioesterase [Pseudomonadota bacterium]